MTVSFADPPSLALDPPADPPNHPASTSAFVGRRSVEISCAADRLLQALKLGFRTLTTVGLGHPVAALDGPRRFVWATRDPHPHHRAVGREMRPEHAGAAVSGFHARHPKSGG